MSNEFSTLPRVKANKGKAQWVQARHVKSETDEVKNLTLHTMEVPYLMPCTTIFVHGVNSEGEWYEDAAKQFAVGLNMRLGRTCIEKLTPKEENKFRFARLNQDGKPYNSPIIPFYWGYKLQPGDLERYPGIYHDDDMAWGGGPFQNGTNNLMSFWQNGFKRKTLAGIVDLQNLNPTIDRQLQDAPPRSYFIHAAKRLAHLIDTIREDFPNEPLNIVAHSQGCMITLCAMLYVKHRAPDTLILNNAPYAFDTKFTDWLSAAHGSSDVQSAAARLKTFGAVAEKMRQAKFDFKDDEKNADYKHQGDEGYNVMHVHHDPERDDWHSQIGSGKVNDQGCAWHECQHASRDNRGKIFVNFNPHDRVIGVSAVAGMGWRGVDEKFIGEYSSATEFSNVYQRVFARNNGTMINPAVGEKQGYWFKYFYEQIVRENVGTGSGGNLTTNYGINVQTENYYLKTFDNLPSYQFWRPLPEKILGLVEVQTTPQESEKVWINAPTVPKPVNLDDRFDAKALPFDGSGIDDNGEQAGDFANFKKFYVPDQVTERNAEGEVIFRKENSQEINEKMNKLGTQPVAQTDHGQILRYDGSGGNPVAQVLSYDLTIDQGYAFGDADYWQYLLDLADWKISDPYYKSGKLADQDGYPPGLDTRTEASK